MTALTLENIQRLSQGWSHCAFTDLLACPFRSDRLLCCYRQAAHHMSHDGDIEVATLTTTGKVIERQRLVLPGWDVRDPKLSIDGKGTLWLTAYAKLFDSTGKMIQTRNVSWFSTTATSWSSLHWFGENRWWLWKFVWQGNLAYSLAYKRPARRLDLFTGHPGKAMQRAVTGVLKEATSGLAFPNETALAIDDEAAMWALARRDGGDMTARFGVARPPYTRWQWHELNCYIGGPAWLPLTRDTMLVGGRDFDGNVVSTKLWLLHKPTAQLSPLCTLPSAGDTSYPGLVIQGDTLFVSYYSSHIDNTTRVYLATLIGIEVLRDVVKEREVGDTGKGR